MKLTPIPYQYVVAAGAAADEPWPKPFARFGIASESCYSAFVYQKSAPIHRETVCVFSPRSVRCVVLDYVFAVSAADLRALVGEASLAEILEGLGPCERRECIAALSLVGTSAGDPLKSVFLSGAGIARVLGKSLCSMPTPLHREVVDFLCRHWPARVYHGREHFASLFDAAVLPFDIPLADLEALIPSWTPEQAASTVYGHPDLDKKDFLTDEMLAMRALSLAVPGTPSRALVLGSDVQPPRDLSAGNGVHLRQVMGRRAWGVVEDGAPYLSDDFVLPWLGLVERGETIEDVGLALASRLPFGWSYPARCADGAVRTMFGWPAMCFLFGKRNLLRPTSYTSLFDVYLFRLALEIMDALPETDPTFLVGHVHEAGSIHAGTSYAAPLQVALQAGPLPTPSLDEGGLVPVTMAELGDKFVAVRTGRFDKDRATIWFSQADIARIFGVELNLVKLSLGREDGPNSVGVKFRTVASDGKAYKIPHYSLETAIEVGMQIDSDRADLFRRVAGEKLAEMTYAGAVDMRGIEDVRIKSVLDPELLRLCEWKPPAYLGEALRRRDPVPASLLAKLVRGDVEVRAVGDVERIFIGNRPMGEHIFSCTRLPLDAQTKGKVLLAAHTYEKLVVVVSEASYDEWRAFIRFDPRIAILVAEADGDEDGDPPSLVGGSQTGPGSDGA